MSPEEYERIKEQEKAHLREMKRLREQVADAQRKGRLASALGGIAGALSHGDDERGELVRKLQQDTALSEARMEMALEGQAERQQAADAAAERARLEAEAAKLEKEAEALRARDTVARLRAEMGLDTPASAAGTPPAAEGGKTLGRTPTADAPAPGSAPPAKTFGRQ